MGITLPSNWFKCEIFINIFYSQFIYFRQCDFYRINLWTPATKSFLYLFVLYQLKQQQLWNVSNLNLSDFLVFEFSSISACDDAKIRVWNIPEGGLTESLTEPESCLVGELFNIFNSLNVLWIYWLSIDNSFMWYNQEAKCNIIF